MATLIVHDNSTPVDDAELLMKACKGWGTDEKAIISLLGHRNAIQRKLIREAYQEIYQEDLIKRLESELSGDFEKAVYRWILDPSDREAVLVNGAIKKSPVIDYQIILEISCVLAPEELLNVKRAYQCRYNHSLEEDIASHSSGDLRKFLVGAVSVYRYVGDEVNARLAKTEADILRKAIEEKQWDHEEVLRIITTRSKTQVMATLNQYKDDHGCSITRHLADDPADDYLAALRIAIRCINDPIKYYEKVVRKALKGHGTDEDTLTRVIISRAEKDLKEIEEQYYKRNSVSLEKAIADDTKGDYKDFLLTLLGKKEY